MTPPPNPKRGIGRGTRGGGVLREKKIVPKRGWVSNDHVGRTGGRGGNRKKKDKVSKKGNVKLCWSVSQIKNMAAALTPTKSIGGEKGQKGGPGGDGPGLDIRGGGQKTKDSELKKTGKINLKKPSCVQGGSARKKKQYC